MSDAFRQGALMRQREVKSHRHQQAGRLGGEATARLHAGLHAAWGAKRNSKEEAAAEQPETPAVGKRGPAKQMTKRRGG